MPIKEEIGTLCFRTESGEWQEISRAIEIPELTESETIDASGLKEFNRDFPINLECDIKYNNGLNAGDFWLILCGFCTFEQATCNNWRRMHNLPLKSRRRK